MLPSDGIMGKWIPELRRALLRMQGSLAWIFDAWWEFSAE